MNAIPTQRMLASHATQSGISFRSGIRNRDYEPLIVFSPAMFLPAVISKAQALAEHVLGSSDVLDIRRHESPTGLLGVEADVGPVDGTPQGLLRGALMARASELVFGFSVLRANAPEVDLDATLARYMSGEGAAIVRGEAPDSVDLEASEVSELLNGGLR
jgi:hypothetical protein